MLSDDEFAAKLERLLEEKGLTSTGLSAAAGLTPSAVSEIIRRKTRSPKLSTVHKLAQALGMTVSQLIGEADLSPDALELARLLDRMDAQDRDAIRRLVDRASG